MKFISYRDQMNNRFITNVNLKPNSLVMNRNGDKFLVLKINKNAIETKKLA